LPPKKISKTALSKNFKNKKSHLDKKISIDELPFRTVKVTLHALRWVFLLIFVYIAVSIFILLIQGGNESIKNIVVYSVTGFFTFFMGYFGWMFARSVMDIVSGKSALEDDF
jgi:drug/metabolite transporter (DMT)-like permease